MKKTYSTPEILEIISVSINDVITASGPVMFNFSNTQGDLDDGLGFRDQMTF